MQSLAHVKDAQMIGSGIFKDTASGQDALWRDCENIHFTNGEVQVVKGYLPLQSAADPIVALEQAYVDGARRIYWASTTAIFRLIDNTVTTLVSGKSAGRWSLEIWGSWLVATNDINPPLVCKNTTTMINLANAPARVKIFKKLANHLIAFGVNGDGQTMQWCSMDDIETWTTTPENTAGDLFLRDLDSEVRAVEELGNALMVYSVNSVGMVKFIGNPYYFGFDKQVEGIGAVGKDAICSVNRVHYGLCRKGFFKFDGANYDYIHNPQMYKWFESQINWQNADTTVSFHDESTGFVYWFFDCLDGTRRGVGYNINSGAWSKFLAPINSAMSKKIFSYGVVGVGNVLGAWNQIGVDLPWWLESARIDFGDRNRWKKIEMLQINGENKTGVQYNLGLAQSTDRDATIEWLGNKNLVADNYIPPRDSVFIELKLSGTGGSFQFGSFQIFGEPTGWR